jgi:DNA polymerase sigma
MKRQDFDDGFVRFSKEEIQVHNGSRNPSSLQPDLNEKIPQSPWQDLAEDIESDDTGAMIRFHNEIIHFCKFIYPTVGQRQARKQVLDELKDVVHSLWPEVQIKVFGSEYTRILTCSSDIDVALLRVPTSLYLSESLSSSASSNFSPNRLVTDVDCLGLLASRLKQRRLASYLEVLSNAKGYYTSHFILYWNTVLFRCFKIVNFVTMIQPDHLL